MKKLFCILVALLPLFLTSCISTEVVDPMEVGLRDSDITGVIIKVKTGGTLFAGSEKRSIAEKADKLGYKYFVILDQDGGFVDNGYSVTLNQWGGSITPRTGYGSVTYSYLFNSKEELEKFLDERTPVYKTEKYLYD